MKYSLVPPNNVTPPKFCGENFCKYPQNLENFLPRKFPAIWYSFHTHDQVDNTDAEGRLLLADALCYAHSFTPTTIIDLATLTGHMDIALGTGAAGVFTTSDPLWKKLHQVRVG